MDYGLQAPPSMAFSRQGYWNGLPFPYPGDFPNLGIEPRSHTLWADTLLSEPPGKPNIPKTKVLCKLYLNKEEGFEILIKDGEVGRFSIHFLLQTHYIWNNFLLKESKKWWSNISTGGKQKGLHIEPSKKG